MGSVTEPKNATATPSEPILICYDDSPNAARAIEAAAALFGPRRAIVVDVPLDGDGRGHRRDVVRRARHCLRGAERKGTRTAASRRGSSPPRARSRSTSEAILSKLRLPVGQDVHRRVLAVLTHLSAR